CGDFGPMPGRRASSSMRSWMGPSYMPASGVSVRGDLRVQLRLEPGQGGFLVGGRRLVLLDDGDGTGHGVTDDAGDLRRDPEDLVERLLQLVDALLHLLHAERAVRGERDLERLAVEGRR